MAHLCIKEKNCPKFFGIHPYTYRSYGREIPTVGDPDGQNHRSTHKHMQKCCCNNLVSFSVCLLAEIQLVNTVPKDTHTHHHNIKNNNILSIRFFLRRTKKRIKTMLNTSKNTPTMHTPRMIMTGVSSVSSVSVETVSLAGFKSDKRINSITESMNKYCS